MFGLQDFLTSVASIAAASCAALSASAWYQASQLPVPDLPEDVTAPTTDIDGKQIPISMLEEANRRKLAGDSIRTFLHITRTSAQLNKRGALLSMYAALWGAIVVVIPLVFRLFP